MNIRALHISTSVTVILVVILTIMSEVNKGFNSSLAGTFGHHWVGKGIISLAVFILLSLVLNAYMGKSEGGAKATFAVTILGGLAIFLFFVWHSLGG